MTFVAELMDTEYGPMILPCFDINQTGAFRATRRGVHHDRMSLLAGLLDAMPGDGDNNRVVIDAGANVGAFALPLAAHVGPRGRVHAFEPQPVLAAMLSGTAALSDRWNILRVHCVCLGDVDGTIEVPQFDMSRRCNFGSIEFGPKQIELLDQQREHDPARVEHVPLRRLDGYGFPRVDLMKIDVQRMEIPLLAGAAETLRRCRPVLFIEWVDNDPAVLRAALASHGYSVRSAHGDDWLCYPD